MFPNVLTTALGLLLVYAAVLQPGLAARHPWLHVAAAVAILLLALWARRSDVVRWMSAVNAALAIALLALGLANWWITLPRLLTFWGVFWIGLVVAVLALWAALYHTASEQAGAS